MPTLPVMGCGTEQLESHDVWREGTGDGEQKLKDNLLSYICGVVTISIFKPNRYKDSPEGLLIPLWRCYLHILNDTQENHSLLSRKMLIVFFMVTT